MPGRKDKSGAARLATQATALATRLVRSRDATILCYHGVGQGSPHDPGSPHISVAQFRDTIALAQSVAEAVPLGELITRRAAGRSTAGLFSVTFDDAYASLAEGDVLKSIEEGLPVCIFVVSASSEAGRPFWWDRLETVQPLAPVQRWLELERTVGVPPEFHTRAAHASGPLRPLRQWLLLQHAGRWPDKAEDALAALERDTGAPGPQRPMTFDELNDLAKRGHVELGVHTATHPVLPLLTDDEVHRELRSCYVALRERWPTTLPWLAAPFGFYDDRTHRLTRDAGLLGFLSLHRHTLAHASSTHGLPRVNISERMPGWKLALLMGGVSRVAARWGASSVGFPPLPGPD